AARHRPAALVNEQRRGAARSNGGGAPRDSGLTLAERVIAGDPRAIARAISLVEDESPAAADLVRAIFAKTGRAYLVGVTGPPGAGKSTLVDRMIAELRGSGSKAARADRPEAISSERHAASVGVIAVDP